MSDPAAPNPYLPMPAEVVLVTREAHQVETFRFELADGAALNFVPGQFLVISILGVGERAVSIASSPTDGPWAELTVANVCAVTAALHHGPTAASIGLRGPFGNGFDTKRLCERSLVLMAGGLGLAPLRSLIRFISAVRSQFGPLAVLYGARTPDHRLYKEELEAWGGIAGSEVCQTVEEDPEGNWSAALGKAPDLVAGLGGDFQDAAAVVCGPQAMIAPAVAALADKGIAARDIQVALDGRIGCGIGKCGRCHIGMKRVCVDGPVFTAEELCKMDGLSLYADGAGGLER